MNNSSAASGDFVHFISATVPIHHRKGCNIRWVAEAVWDEIFIVKREVQGKREVDTPF